jgi:hypothetical protein
MIAASRVESGPDSQGYAFLAQTVRSLVPLLKRTGGAATVEEVPIDTFGRSIAAGSGDK